MKRAIVYTRDELVYRKLSLLLSEEYELYRKEDGEVDTAPEAIDVTVDDIDTCPTVGGGDVLLSRHNKDGVIGIPFSISDIENTIKNHKKRDTGRLILLSDERAVMLDGVNIKLTDVEYRLLRALLSVPIGEYVSKQRLVEEVWDGAADSGVVNVYVHYLREKLEKGGEKIILSSRNRGYKINERTVGIC